MIRIWLLGLLLPGWLAAQWTLNIVKAGQEQSVGDVCDLGAVPAGDSFDTAFRLRNSSTGAATLRGLNLAGQGFSFAALPDLPLDVAAGGTVDFAVRFHPLLPGSYSAYLNIEGARTVLLATASAAIVLKVSGRDGDIVLSSGETVDFGTVELGSRSARQFALANPSGVALSVGAFGLSGTSFHTAFAAAVPLRLEAGQSVPFEVEFEPQAGGTHEGVLQVDQRRFLLRGAGREPAYPKPRIVLESSALAAGKQAKASIRLESAATAPGQGELSLEFSAGVPGKPDDPAVLFPATGKRSAAFTVTVGQDMAKFGDRTEIEFQTGTTAGTITLTAKLGEHVETRTVTIPAAPVTIDSVRCLRSATGLEVRVNAFDSSRSASSLSFTFYDAQGSPIQPGAIRVDVLSPFRQYFDASDFGGAFSLVAVFPVSGDVLKITAFEVEVANSLGAARAPRTVVQ